MNTIRYNLINFLISFSHVDETTTCTDPSSVCDDVVPPQPRVLTLQRDSKLGFGFVAGSEKPVIVRFVTEGKYN